ncbi:MAG: glycosyltransferase family 39 protein [Candidatus Magnetominusculus sp. LBB02]|nr:glycosyltransferase family 39 protein [Candidatus Magnetominusculus sp. LBB02]
MAKKTKVTVKHEAIVKENAASAFLQAHYVKALLLVFVIYGFSLRAYHIDYVSIGLHNLKENQHLSEALNFYNKGISIHREVFFQAADKDIPYYEEYPQFPLIPYIGVLLWKIFGINFWTMRLQIILFSLGTIPLSYLVTKKVTGDDVLSLVTAGFMTIMPLNVFFGRNIQPESHCLLLLLVFYYCFIKWAEDGRLRNALYVAGSAALIGLLKISFLVPTIAVLPFVPYRRMLDDLKSLNFGRYYGFAVLAILPFYIWLTKITNINEGLTEGSLHNIKPFDPFTAQYWKANGTAIMLFWIDNYSTLLGIAMFLGLALLLFAKGRTRAFFLAYLGSFVVYMMIFSLYFYQHSYYQMPYVYLAAFAMAYMFHYLFTVVIKIKHLKYASFLVLILSLYPMKASITRHFDSQFLGTDVAGEYIKSHTGATDRFLILATAQKLATCYFAERFCFALPADEEEVKKFEKKFNSKYIFIYNNSMQQAMSQKSWDYVTNNYKIAEVGLINTGESAAPGDNGFRVSYLILEKGGTFSMDTINGKVPELKKYYEFSYATNFPFYTIEP